MAESRQNAECHTERLFCDVLNRRKKCLIICLPCVLQRAGRLCKYDMTCRGSPHVVQRAISTALMHKGHDRSQVARNPCCRRPACTSPTPTHSGTPHQHIKSSNMRRDAYDAIMVELSRRMPYITAFPRALGTGLLIHTARPLDDELHVRIGDFIDEYESVTSRFRNDSLVAAMAKAEHGGAFAFPDWTLPLFMLCDVLAAASAGAIDPCIGEDMIRLGYGADLTFTMQPDAANHLGAIHGRPTWEHDVARDGTTLRTIRPAQLDFGACGKGYLVDLLGMMLCEQSGSAAEFLIDAGGDMLINSRDSIDIALEDPTDTNNAVGIAHISSGAFCASAPSRRHWGEAHELRLHHLLNAIDGQPVNNVAATWVYVNANLLSANSSNADSPSGTRVSTLPLTSPSPVSRTPLPSPTVWRPRSSRPSRNAWPLLPISHAPSSSPTAAWSPAATSQERSSLPSNHLPAHSALAYTRLRTTTKFRNLLYGRIAAPIYRNRLYLISIDFLD